MSSQQSNQIKNVIFIQIVNSFISGILVILLPLLMLNRNIDIVTIGLIYSSLPIIFQLARMFFAILSDFIGRKIFFVLNGILKIFSILIYYFSYTPYHFLFGKISEGVKEASNWSVNRAFILEKAKEKRKELTKMRAFTSISEAFGSLAAGFLIIWFFYSNTLIFCFLVAFLILPNALALKNKHEKKFDVKKALRLLDLKRKGKKFKKTLFIFCVLGSSYGFIAGYVFPLFLKSNGFGVEVIGLLLGFQILLAGLFTYFSIRKIKLEKLIFYGGIFYSIVLLLLGFSASILAAILVLLYGIASGVVDAGFEGIFSRVTNKESYGTDIGLLFMGFHTARTISLMLSGFLIAIYGFFAPFSLSALIFIGYFLLAYHTFRGK